MQFCLGGGGGVAAILADVLVPKTVQVSTVL